MTKHILPLQRSRFLTNAQAIRPRRRLRVKAHTRIVPRYQLDRPLIVDVRWTEIERLIVAIAKTVERDGSLALHKAQKVPASNLRLLLDDLFS